MGQSPANIIWYDGPTPQRAIIETVKVEGFEGRSLTGEELAEAEECFKVRCQREPRLTQILELMCLVAARGTLGIGPTRGLD